MTNDERARAIVVRYLQHCGLDPELTECEEVLVHDIARSMKPEAEKPAARVLVHVTGFARRKAP